MLGHLSHDPAVLHPPELGGGAAGGARAGRHGQKELGGDRLRGGLLHGQKELGGDRLRGGPLGGFGGDRGGDSTSVEGVLMEEVLIKKGLFIEDDGGWRREGRVRRRKYHFFYELGWGDG